MVGMPGCLPCRPSPSASTTSVSTHPSGVQVSSRPVSSCPDTGRLAPSSPVPLSGRLVSSPSGVQPVRGSAVRCPSVRPSHPSGPASARRRRLGTPRYGGQSSCLERIEFHVVRPRPSGSVDGPGRPGCGHRCGGRMEASGGASAADLAGLCSGGVAAADRPGRPDRRKGAHRQRLRQAGCWLKRDAPAPAAWLPSCWSATTLRGCRGA